MLLHPRLVPPPSPTPSPNPNPNPNRKPNSLLLPSTPTSTSCGGVEFRRKLHFLSGHLGLDPFSLLSRNPSLRTASLPLLRASFHLLLSHGLSAADAARVYAAFPALLTSPPHSPLAFLSTAAALPPPLLRAAAVSSPRLLAASVPDTLLPALRFLRRRVGLHRRPLPVAAALLLAFSVDRTLLPKLLFLQSAAGLPEPAVCGIVRRAPAILSYGIESNLTPKLEFLCNCMGRDPAVELREFPHYFAFSLQRRIRPRYEMLKERGAEMSLAEMLTCSDGEFRERLLDMKLAAIGDRL